MSWKHCSIHGESNTDRAWACPDCMAEARSGNQRLKAELEQANAEVERGLAYQKQITVTAGNRMATLDATNRRLTEELQAANLTHEQYREWAAWQIEKVKAALAILIEACHKRDAGDPLFDRAVRNAEALLGNDGEP